MLRIILRGIIRFILNIKNIRYGLSVDALDTAVSTRGYRILNKIPRLPFAVIENLLERFPSFQEILKASTEQLDDVEGIGEVRARAIRKA